jgi:hypothetical protein
MRAVYRARKPRSPTKAKGAPLEFADAKLPHHSLLLRTRHIQQYSNIQRFFRLQCLTHRMIARDDPSCSATRWMSAREPTAISQTGAVEFEPTRIFWGNDDFLLYQR